MVKNSPKIDPLAIYLDVLELELRTIPEKKWKDDALASRPGSAGASSHILSISMKVHAGS